MTSSIQSKTQFPIIFLYKQFNKQILEARFTVLKVLAVFKSFTKKCRNDTIYLELKIYPTHTATGYLLYKRPVFLYDFCIDWCVVLGVSHEIFILNIIYILFFLNRTCIVHDQRCITVYIHDNL